MSLQLLSIDMDAMWQLGSQDKLEKINERALRLAYSDYSSSYKDLFAN